MRRARFGRWSGTYLPSRNPRTANLALRAHDEIYISLPYRGVLTAEKSIASTIRCIHTSIPRRQEVQPATPLETRTPKDQSNRQVDPKSRRRYKSAKLGALHARLSLPPRFSLPTLVRCLTHPSADPRPQSNNESLAILGQEMIAYYTAEWLLCNYPRLPISILQEAQYAYAGDRALAALRQEWGVDVADAPGPEVDAGYLQFERVIAGNAMAPDQQHRVKDVAGETRPVGTGRPREEFHDRRGFSSRIVFDDEFGDLRSGVHTDPVALSLNANLSESLTGDDVGKQNPSNGVTLEAASASFIRAVFGALYLYSGATSMQAFHSAHILSRKLALHTLFKFREPERDLRRLCDREKFELPVARLISETGRRSRSPVFVVGIYSGKNKLGEDAGSSLNEGRTRAAAQALRSWYLYSPPADQICLPSKQAEMTKRKQQWKPQMIDSGEIVT